MASLEWNKFRYDSLLRLCDAIDRDDTISYYENINMNLRSRVEIDIIMYIQHLCAMCSGLADRTSDFINEYWGNYSQNICKFERKAKEYCGDIKFFTIVPAAFKALVEVDNMYEQNLARLMYKVYHDISLTFFAYNRDRMTKESGACFKTYQNILTNYAKEHLNNNSWTSTQYDFNSWLYDDEWYSLK